MRIDRKDLDNIRLAIRVFRSAKENANGRSLAAGMAGVVMALFGGCDANKAWATYNSLYTHCHTLLVHLGEVHSSSTELDQRLCNDIAKRYIADRDNLQHATEGCIKLVDAVAALDDVFAKIAPAVVNVEKSAEEEKDGESAPLLTRKG